MVQVGSLRLSQAPHTSQNLGMKESSRTVQLPESATLGLAARANEMRARGVDVLSMAVGEPDFQAPEAARQAAIRAIGGDVKYTHSGGILSLRNALTKHLQRTRGLHYDSSQIVVGHSCKHMLCSSLLALVEPGDEVLLPTPAWNSYDALVNFAQGKPIHLAPKPDLSPDLDLLASSIGPRPRGIFFSTPGNPSGYVWGRAELEALMEIAKAKDLWIISDEIYSRLVYEGEPFCSAAAISEDAAARTVIVDGASKSFAMTGYRIGYMAGPSQIAQGITRLQSQSTGCPNYVSQYAYEEVLLEEPPEVEAMANEFNRRRLRLQAGLESLGLDAPRPRGAFYSFPNVSAYCDERGTAGFCEDLLKAEAMAIVPGTVFGLEGHVRLSYALSMDRIDEAILRLGRFLKTKKG